MFAIPPHERWRLQALDPLLVLLPFSAHGGKPIDKFATSSAAETGCHAQRPRLRSAVLPCTRPQDPNQPNSTLRRTPCSIVSHGQRRAAASSGPLGELRRNLVNDRWLVTWRMIRHGDNVSIRRERQASPTRQTQWRMISRTTSTIASTST